MTIHYRGCLKHYHTKKNTTAIFFFCLSNTAWVRFIILVPLITIMISLFILFCFYNSFYKFWTSEVCFRFSWRNVFSSENLFRQDLNILSCDTVVFLQFHCFNSTVQNWAIGGTNSMWNFFECFIRFITSCNVLSLVNSNVSSLCVSHLLFSLFFVRLFGSSVFDIYNFDPFFKKCGHKLYHIYTIKPV